MNSNRKLFVAILILGLMLALPGGLFSQQRDVQFNHYRELNRSEERLAEYRDSDEMLKLKLQQLELINSSRRKHNAPPVKFDILASRVANSISREAAINAYVGHWNMKGEKPYQRYSLAGGVDHVAENASGVSTTGSFNQSPASILELMEESHQAFMAEKKPADGHKQTVINKLHNYVGLGVYITETEFRYYELYIDRYYTFGPVPDRVSPGESVSIYCHPGKGVYINLVMVYYEKAPSAMKPREISSRPYYNDFTESIAHEIAPWDCDAMRDSEGGYKMQFKFDRPGDYYVQIYSSGSPYKSGDRFSTEGKLQASGVVIRVR